MTKGLPIEIACVTLVCESTLDLPPLHPPETRRALGIGDGLVRLSIGIENANDLIEDLGRYLWPSTVVEVPPWTDPVLRCTLGARGASSHER